MMNICLLSNKYPPDPGGLAISVQRLARGLIAAGHTVHVCVPSSALGPGQVSTTVEDSLKLHCLGVHRRTDDTWADWFHLITALHAENRFDLLHGYYLAGAGFVTVYAGRYLELPTIVSARGNDLDRTVFDPGKAGAILWALANASTVTAVSTELTRKAQALAPNRPVTVIHNSVDTLTFAPAPRNEALLKRLALDGAPLIGFVGEARLKKGLTILLPAFAQVATTVAKVGQTLHLLLIGGVRKEDADILRVFRAQSPDQQVHVLPYTDQSQLPAFYNLLDILTLPSLHDGLPNALLEGMACERAVIASQVGGMPDVLRHGKNGLLVPAGNVEGLAEALLALLSAPERRATLGRAARETVCSDFTPARELAENLKLYAHLTGLT